MNSIPMVVFPVPAVPSTSTTLPRRRPPARMSSSPAMPVLTKSRSGMVNTTCPKSRWSYAGKATGARVADRRPRLRPSLLQDCPQRVPSLWRGAHSPQRFQPFLGMADFEDIHPPGGAVVERPLQETDADQQIER